MTTADCRTIAEVRASLNAEEIGSRMYALMSALYPICRSITGDGFRRTLNILQEQMPLEIREVPSGTKVFDWTVPKEWNVTDAYVKNSWGEKVIDFNKSNLHLVSYSVPVRTKLRLPELKEHLHTLPDHPDWIPYRTSYYRETWGFCISHNQFVDLKDDQYEVVIDSSLRDGHLSYGECHIGGDSSDEVLLSCHACHPSLCNDNLSGVVVNTFLAKYLAGMTLRYSYRFLFIPGGIGSVVWLAGNEETVGRIRHGLVLTCLGDPGGFTYKKSRRGDAEIDRAALSALRRSERPYEVIDFSPYGYDERNYCSPGFDLPVGSLTRTTHGRYPEYHTSADDLSLIRPECLAESFSTCMSILSILELNTRYISQCPKCEPQLGKRGLYGLTGGLQDRPASEVAMLWVLNLSDGEHTLLDISDRSGIDFGRIAHAADLLCEHGLLKAVPGTEQVARR